MCRERRILGSALILTVVLTSLLAIVGVLFLMTTRVDRMATSATSQNKELDLAIDAIVAKISEQLIWDVPGTRLAAGRYPEYHDYPGPEDRWLASIEPNVADKGTAAPTDDEYYWPQISDITTWDLRSIGWRTRNILIADTVTTPSVFKAVVPDHKQIALDVDGNLLEQLADADGDGVADSKWIILEGVTTSKGKSIYMAVRVVDNCGMINVNTAFQFYFDPRFPDMNSIDGTSLWHINLMALANRRGVAPTLDDETALLEARANYGVNLDPNRLDLYEDNVSWRYGELSMPYTPFDISDELELRNRFLLNQRDTYARIEQLGYPTEWTNAFRIGLKVPAGSASGPTLDNWFDHANISRDPNLYDYRHLATTYSMDRIINPIGQAFLNGKMVNVNTAGQALLRTAIKMGLWDADPNLRPVPVDALAAQITANIIDYRDDNSSVTRVVDINVAPHYGFERPCIYISEVAAAVKDVSPGTRSSYAIELHKPYFEDDIAGSGMWRLMIDSNTVPINWSGTRRFHVVRFEDPCAPLGVVDFNDPMEPTDPLPLFGYSKGTPSVRDDSGVAFSAGSTILLQRSAPGGFITVDSYTIPAANATSGWLTASVVGPALSIQRDISLHKCIRRLWGTAAAPNDPNLGQLNTYIDSSALGRIQVQAHPYLDPAIYTDRFGRVGFKNIGEIGMVFDVNAYNIPVGSTEADLRLDLQKNRYARILSYLIVLDPSDHGHPAEEKRVKGRININTAPSYVLEQLPWMDSKVSQAVVAYRDKLELLPDIVDYSVGRAKGMWDLDSKSPPPIWVREEPGFANISELLNVTHDLAGKGPPFYDSLYDIRKHGRDKLDETAFPDLTRRDGAVDDFEERDLIFHRISNLVTVRSDVFTAYILVRIGADGPQRRMIAILDRSGVFPRSTAPYTSGKVKVRALHQVPDPW
jgi:hypothetical protein